MRKIWILLIACVLTLHIGCQKELTNEDVKSEKLNNPVSSEFTYNSVSDLLDRINSPFDPVGSYTTRGGKDSTSGNSDDEVVEMTELEECVPNGGFRRCMNDSGEFVVGDTVYCVTREGTYYSKLRYIDDLRRVRRENRGKVVFADEEDIKTFGNVKLKNSYSCETSIDVLDENDSYYLDDQQDSIEESPKPLRGRKFYEPVISDFPLKNMDREGSIFRFLGRFFGFNKDGIVYFRSNRRLKAALYSYNYVVYAESGVRACVQKKMWYGGWGRMKNWDRGTTIGWNNVVLRIPLPKNPTIESQLKQIRAMGKNVWNDGVAYKLAQLSNEPVDFSKFPFSVSDEVLCIPYYFGTYSVSAAEIQKVLYKLAAKSVEKMVDSWAEKMNRKSYADGMIVFTDRNDYVYILYNNSSRWKPGASQTALFHKGGSFIVSYNSNSSPVRNIMNSIIRTARQEAPMIVSGEAFAYTWDDRWVGMRMYKLDKR